MKITIENFKNLKKLNYEIIDNKVNFLFGLSGSGKSSIVSALASDDPNDDKMIGTAETDNVKVEVDGVHISPDKVHIFDIEKMNFILEENDIESFREVVLVNSSEHEKIHMELENKLKELSKAINEEFPIYDDYNHILESFKLSKLTKSGSIPNTSVFSKVMTKLKSLNKTRLFKQIVSMDNALFEWKMKGVPLISGGVCPFCNKRLNKNTINKLVKMSQFDSKSIGELKLKMRENNSIMGGSLAYNLREMKTIEKRLVKIFNAAKIFKEINAQIHDFFEEDYQHRSFKRIVLTKEFKNSFPKTCKEYLNVCRNMRSLESSIKKMQEKTQIFLSGKKKIINNIFLSMDIPYVFDVKYHRSGPNEYYLTHKNNLVDSDDKHRMSEGEKAIVTLILFLVSSSHTKYKIYFIDDPVSSFDTYRRKIIFDLILKYLSDKTTVVVSHDHIFAKFAINVTDNTKRNQIGNVSYLSNNGLNEAIVESVKNVSIESFNKSVINRCNCASNQYEQSILARMLFEEKCGHRSVIYSYLSKIMHGYDHPVIMKWLANRNQDENVLISDINSKLEKMGVRANYLSCLSLSYNKNIDISGYTIFEKCIIFREIVDNNKKAYSPMIKNELNNSVHLTEALAIGINAFEFPIISRTLSDEIKTLGDVVSF